MENNDLCILKKMFPLGFEVTKDDLKCQTTISCTLHAKVVVSDFIFVQIKNIDELVSIIKRDILSGLDKELFKLRED